MLNQKVKEMSLELAFRTETGKDTEQCGGFVASCPGILHSKPDYLNMLLKTVFSTFNFNLKENKTTQPH